MAGLGLQLEHEERAGWREVRREGHGAWLPNWGATPRKTECQRF